MVSCGNVGLFIWRRLLMQTLWRHYIGLAVELTFVVMTFVYLLSHDRVDPAQVKKLNRSYIIPDEPQAVDAKHIRHKLPTGLTVVYGPATADTDRLIAAVFNAVGREFSMEEAQDPELVPSNVELARKDYIVRLDEASSVPDKCRAVASRLLHQNSYASTMDRIMCVQFFKPDDTRSLQYNLIVLLPPEVMLPQGVLYSLQELFVNPSIAAGGDVLAKVADTIQVQQALIDHAHMVLQGGFSNSTQLFSGHIPMEAPFEDIHNYRNGLFAAVTIGFCLPLVWRVRDITREIASGHKEMQEVMGLSSNDFWVGHFLSALPISLVESALAAAVLVLHEKDYTPSVNVTVYKGDDLEVLAASFNSTTTGPPTRREPRPERFIRVNTYEPRVTRYLENADGSLVAATFALFALCHTLLALLIACVFPFGRWAMVIGFAVYFMLPSVDGDKLGLVFGNSLFAYLTRSRNDKLRTAFYPSVALSNAMKIIGIFDDFEKAARWNILPKPALNLDTVALKDMWAIMITTCIAFMIMIAYLSEVLPWTASWPKPLLFFLKPRYWFPLEPRVTESEAAIKSPESGDRFQSPPELRAALECKNLVKVFNGVVALNKVNVSIYGSQVTVLLGHNGAGKTTLMSILTGLLKADSGTVFLHEREITTYSVRGIMGFCPQTDVFFSDLTVRDHLQYFGMLKGLRSSEINRYVKMLLDTVQLNDKLYAYPGELSGGMKRKLSIAIALITRPKVLILDEPTVGMDPETRRVIWTIVQGLRGRTTLVLSTHDMEEADTLADRIIVMYNGNVICAGSPSFLKNASGVGYKLRIAKGPGVFRGNDTLVVTRKAVPRATIEQDKETEMVIALNTLKRKGFEAMFRELEEKSAALGIQSIGVTVATMKDAYIRIYNLWAEGPKDQAYETESSYLSETTMFSIATDRREPRRCQRFRALIQKRLLYQWRTPFLFFTGWILPVFIAFTGLGIVKLKSFRLPVQYRHIDLNAAAFVDDEPPLRTFIQEMDKTNESLSYRVLLESTDVRYTVLDDALRRLLIFFDKKFFKYVTFYAFGCVFRDKVIEMWSNPLSVIAASIQRNLVDTVLLRQQTGQPNTRFQTGVSLYALTEEELYADVRQRDPLSGLRSLLAHTWAYWGAMASVSFGLIMSSFVVLPSLEVCSEARDLQLMTGISGFLYLGAHFLFDLIFYLVPMAIIYGGFAAIFEVPSDALESLILIVLAFAPVGIFLPYFISEHTTDGSTAYAVILGLFAIAGPGSIIGFLIAADTFPGQKLRTALMFFPPFALPATTVRAINLEYEVAICEYLRSKTFLRKKHVDFCNSVKMYGSTINDCCDILTNGTRKSWSEIRAVSVSSHGIVPDILIMLALGVFLFAYLAHRVSGLPLFRSPRTCPPQRPSNKQDADVAVERAVVELICKQKRFGQHTMVARNLHKVFRQVHAVRGLSFTVRRAECFGLLGVNGAGKTTTFRMLAALTRPTYGDAYMRDAVLSEEPRWWQSKIGYCPQDGALLEKLSAYEMLYLFGRLRGVPEEDLGAAVDRIIGATDLRKHAAKRCQVYSVGTKRKLSMAVALIGSPAVVFLDEPYAGVDVLARARIHDGLASLKAGTDCTIVLTSHSMEECELSCDRMCIMVEGELVCLGTLQHLKDKFGKGYKLLFTLTDDTRTAVEQLTRAVRSTLPAITVIDVRRKVVEFRMETKIPWSKLFQKLAALEKDFAFEHVFVSDNTLEQIFIEFARKAHEHANAGRETDTTRQPHDNMRKP